MREVRVRRHGKSWSLVVDDGSRSHNWEASRRKWFSRN